MKPRTLTWMAGTVAMAVALGTAGCSSQGGREDDGGKDLDLKIAMVTHAQSGDTFWDIVRKGADDAADNYGVKLEYSNDVDIDKQATLVQNAIDRKVDGIALSVPNPDALHPVIAEAVDAGIPVVALNAGVDDWQDSGALAFFGQDESVSGEAAGGRLKEEKAGKVLCVLHAQGQVQLESRCDGVESGFGDDYEKLYVKGEDMPSVQSTIEAKLREDKSITHVMTLGAPIALTAVKAVEDAGTEAKVTTFDLNGDLVDAIKAGDVEWAIDQQPYLQGFHSVTELILYNSNGTVIGGGETVLTGPSFVDKDNAAEVEKHAKDGTR